VNNPIVERELIGLLRTRRAMALQVCLALVLALLVVLRWPGEARVELSGARPQEVFRLFGYGLLTLLILLAPAAACYAMGGISLTAEMAALYAILAVVTVGPHWFLQGKPGIGPLVNPVMVKEFRSRRFGRSHQLRTGKRRLGPAAHDALVVRSHPARQALERDFHPRFDPVTLAMPCSLCGWSLNALVNPKMP